MDFPLFVDKVLWFRLTFGGRMKESKGPAPSKETVPKTLHKRGRLISRCGVQTYGVGRSLLNHFYFAAVLASVVKYTDVDMFQQWNNMYYMKGNKMETSNRELTIQYLTEHKQRLLERRQQLMKPLQEVDQEIEHVDATLRSIQQKSTVTAGFRVPFEASDFPIAQIRSLTQVQALVRIAKHCGGTFKAQEAKRLLIKSGVMRQTKNSTNVIHAVIRRSEKFERVRPGEYRLKNFTATAVGSIAADVPNAIVLSQKPQ